MVDEATRGAIDAEARRQVGETGPAGRRGRGQAMSEVMRRLNREQGAEAVLQRASGERGASRGRRADFLLQLDAARRPNAEAQIDAANGLLRGGYDSLAGPLQDVWRDQIKRNLDTSRMGEVTRGVTTPREVQGLTEGFLRDEQFLLVYQQQLDRALNARPNLTKEVVTERAQLLRADDPVTYPDMATARTAARARLLDEWRENQGEELRNLPRAALDAYFVNNLRNAQQASGEANSLVVRGAIADRERRWNQPGRVGRRAATEDFNTFMQGGGERVLGRDEWSRMSEEDREEFNKRYGEKMFTARMLAGKLNQDDLRGLANAEWLGADFPARVDKIRGMFEANDQFKELIAEGQANGTVDRNLWDRIKAAGPFALTGSVLALLASLAFPPSAFGYGLLALGGAAGGAAARLGVDRLQEIA
ncbi:MAG TPA: hypothetical protein VLF93_04060 [Candidatus Saccharimonadales bacterium]|nr:hypothetical protein [Candidatus Saccharimonadales bacterium]